MCVWSLFDLRDSRIHSHNHNHIDPSAASVSRLTAHLHRVPGGNARAATLVTASVKGLDFYSLPALRHLQHMAVPGALCLCLGPGWIAVVTAGLMLQLWAVSTPRILWQRSLLRLGIPGGARVQGM